MLIWHKLGEETIKFSDIEIGKHTFHQYKNPISLYDVWCIVLSNKVPFGVKGFKYFIGYENDIEKVMPLCIILRKTSAYRINRDEAKYKSFLIKDNELLEKYNEISDNISKVVKKGFDSEPVYNEKYLKAKIKSYERKVNINFHNDKMPKEGSHCVCLSVVLTESVFKTGKNYYSQV